MEYQEIKGNLITLATEGKFDVIAHGCNCFTTMGAGIALQMNQAFNALLHDITYDLNVSKPVEKLGNIDWFKGTVSKYKSLTVINAYTQYVPGPNLDYEALILCMRKINNIFFNRHIGLPQIGCGIAGGDWEKVKEIIKRELTDCKVTIVIYDDN